jgi:hypothetical protein
MLNIISLYMLQDWLSEFPLLEDLVMTIIECDTLQSSDFSLCLLLISINRLHSILTGTTY